MRKIAFAGLTFLGFASVAQAASNCAEVATAQPAPARATLVSPVSGELVGINTQLGAPSGVLASAYDESLSADSVLLRQRVEACKQVAAAETKAPAAAPQVNDPAGYKPKTEHDNTPYRFSMTQNGKKMTADDFDAWLKATGYSAGKRAEAAEPAEAPAVVAEPQPEEKGKKKKK